MTTNLADWELLDAATSARKRLLAQGYLPLPCVGKVPPIAGWSDIMATETIIDGWARGCPAAINTGILARDVPAIDIDIADAAAAEAIEELARERFGDRGWF